MKSIQTSFVALVLSTLFCAIAIMGGIGFFNINSVVNEDSEKIMNLLCREKAQSINSHLVAIEQSVDTVAMYITGNFKDNSSFSEKNMEPISNVALQHVANTPSSNAFFFKINEERFPDQKGFIYVRRLEDGIFEEQTPRQFFERTGLTIEKMPGYVKAVEKSCPVWSEPYYNDFLKTRLITYSAPLYDAKNRLLGVLMLDARFDFLENLVDETELYENGYAFLINADGKVMRHKDLPFGADIYELESSLIPAAEKIKNGVENDNIIKYNYQNEQKRMVFTELRNGMRLVVTTHAKDIDSAKKNIFIQTILFILFIGGIFVFITLSMTYRITQPLKELTEAAKRISDGDMSVELTYYGKNEIGILSDSFRQMADNLKRYVCHINNIAYHDALTGVNNKTAYQEEVAHLNELIQNGKPEFAVAVFDLNNLKAANDNFGHTYGDKMIVSACKIVCNVFCHSPVYRIGGDEFVAVLENNDYNNRRELINAINKETSAFNASSDFQISVSIAKGVAEYTEGVDKNYDDVFARADAEMYKDKLNMKGNNTR